VAFANPVNNMDAPELVNITILVPNGTLTHDNGHILCVYGNSWRKTLYIAAFFAANYAAHAATIKSNPGDRTSVTVCNMILALFFPVSGLMRAVNAIVRFGRWGGSDLEKACRSGALCMVARVHGWLPTIDQTLDAAVMRETWTSFPRHQHHRSELPNAEEPADHDQRSLGVVVEVYRPNFGVEGSSKWLYSDAAGGRANVHLSATKVHGTYSLPRGYGFAILPRNTCLVEWTNISGDHTCTSTKGSEIACTYSLAKALVSIIQTLAAFAILLGHRHDIVRRWGFASFHLTILPYLVMTIFNFVSNICTADYDGLYMVETHVMDEARKRGGQFEGTVAGTYTATTFGPERLPGLSNSERRSYEGLQHSHVRNLALRITELWKLFPFSLFRSGIWMRYAITSQTISVKAVINPGNAVDTAAAQSTDCDPVIEQLYPSTDTRSDTSENSTSDDFVARLLRRIPGSRFHESLSNETVLHDGSSLHTCDKANVAQMDCHTTKDAKIILVSDDGVSYIARMPNNPPNLMTAIGLNINTNLAKRLRYHAVNVQTFLSGIENHVNQRLSPNADQNGYLSPLKTGFNLARETQFMFARALIKSENMLETPCAVCIREKATKIHKTKICFPMCHRFLRSDDIPKEIDGQVLLIPPSMETMGPEYERSGSVREPLPARAWHRAAGGVAAQITIGLAVTGLIVILIGWQSDWFSAGQASLTQRTIMLLWMCEGVVGTDPSPSPSNRACPHDAYPSRARPFQHCWSQYQGSPLCCPSCGHACHGGGARACPGCVHASPCGGHCHPSPSPCPHRSYNRPQPLLRGRYPVPLGVWRDRDPVIPRACRRRRRRCVRGGRIASG
jgi:hypothetical protein